MWTRTVQCAIMRGQERISNEIVLLINFVAVFLCVASRNRMFDLQCKNWHTMCWLLSKHTKMLEKRFITVEFPVVFLPRCGDLYAALSWLGFSMPERLAEVKLLRMKTYTLHSFWEGEIFGEFSVYISLYSSRTSHAHRGSGQRLVWTNCYYYYLLGKVANWLNGFIAIDWAEHGLYKNNKESAAIKYFAWTPNAERWSITAIITSNRQRSFCIEKDMIEANFTNSTEKRFLFIYWGHRGCARFSHGRPIVLSLSIAIYLFFYYFSSPLYSHFRFGTLSRARPKKESHKFIGKRHLNLLPSIDIKCDAISSRCFGSWHKFIFTPIRATE